MFSLFKKRPEAPKYDPATEQPAVRRSICTGEMTAGFIDLKTGKFRDIMCVDGQKGLERFCAQIGAKPEDVKTIY